MFKFGCTQCGQFIEVEAPDTTYKELLLQPCDDKEGDPQHNYEQSYECQNCYFKNISTTIRYWCRGHVYFASSGDNTGDIKHKSAKYARKQGFG
jgi:hypothetical protein